MAIASEEFLDRVENRILNRLVPQERSPVRSLLQNVIILIKRVRGQQLSEDERVYPLHPLLAVIGQKAGEMTLQTLLYRLHLVDRYEFNKSKDIISVLTRKIPIGINESLSARKAQILWHLFQNPSLPKYQLAKELGTTPRTISKELTELHQDLAFNIWTTLDAHKFHFVVKTIIFRTRSIEHTKRLENFISKGQGFLRTFHLDQDIRSGEIVYRYPDQPEAHKMFKERYRWLQDEFFIESHLVQILGLFQSISLETYNPATNSFSIEPEIVSEAPFGYFKGHLDTLPQPQGIDYTQPFRFDKADFLLADTLYSSGPFRKSDYKRNLLNRHGINYSMKTVWKKEQRLRRENAAIPMIDLQIPGFDEDLLFVVFCTPDATKSIHAISAFLPFVMTFNTDSGCFLRIQRPIHTSTLTGQLIRKINHQKGVFDVKLLRFQWRIQMPILPKIVDCWNIEEQKWLIQEDAI